ncbi:hypothetical protein AAZX31_03G023200 [Glycine max]
MDTMKLVWSPESALKFYIDTLKSYLCILCRHHNLFNEQEVAAEATTFWCSVTLLLVAKKHNCSLNNPHMIFISPPRN